MSTKTLSQLALPMVVSFTFRFLFTLVDTIYAAAIKDQEPDAVAAIGLFIPIQTIFIALWVGLSAGFTASLAQAFGRRDESRITALKAGMIRIHLWLTPLLLGFAALLYLGIPRLGLEPGLTESFRTYSVILVAGFPLAGLLSIHPDSIVKAHHDTVSTMWAGLCSSVTNVALNTLFVFVFGWGLFGIALATLLSRFAGFGYAVWRVRILEAKRRATPWPEAAPLPGERPAVRHILTLAVPGSLAYLLVFLEEGLIAKLLTGLEHSTVMIASYGVYNRLLSLACMPVIATAVAVLPFVARLIPEGRIDQIVRDLRRSLLQCLGLSLLIAIPVGWIFAGPLAAFLVPGKADLAGEHAIVYLRLLPLAALSVCPFLLLRPIYEAANRPRIGIRLAMIKTFVFAMPLTVAGYYLAPVLGQDSLFGILVGVAVSALLASGASILLSRQLLRDVCPRKEAEADASGAGV